MIVDSYYWRRELFRSASKIRIKNEQEFWRPESSSILEFALMTGAFSVRRLADSGKSPVEALEKPIPGAEMPVKVYNPRRIRYSPPIDVLYASGMFDYESARPATLKPIDFINQLIHSSIFFYVLMDRDETGGENRQMALFVSSDREKRKRLLAFWLSDVALFYERIAIAEPRLARKYWNEKKGDWASEVSEVEFGMQLVESGAVSSEAMSECIIRLKKSNTTEPRLDQWVRRIGRDLGDEFS